MKRILYFFVAVSVFVFISCGSDNSTANTQKTETKEVIESPKVITSTIIRVDRIICTGGYSSYSKTVILTDDGRSFSFRDSDNIGSVNVREGDVAQYLLYGDGKTELEGIAYAINK